MKHAALALLALSACAHHAPGARPAPQPAPQARTEHCTGIVRSKAGPLCVLAISAEQAQHRAASYVVRYEGERLVSAQRVNGRGYPAPDDDDEVDYSYRYQNGLLVESIFRDVDGNIRSRTLSDADHAAKVDEWGRPKLDADREWTKMTIEWDARGFSARERYFGPDDRPARNVDGAYESRFERDARGMPTRECYFDGQGRPMRDRYGVHCYGFRRDAAEAPLERLTFDEHGQPIGDVLGVTRIEFTYDEYGNVVRSHWVVGADVPRQYCALQRSYHDAFGSRVGVDCLDEQEKPRTWLVGHAAWRSTADERGWDFEERDFDVHGELTRTDGGYARREFERDAHGHITLTRFYLEDGSLGQTDGPAIIENQYDAKGLMTRARYFDAKREPTERHGCYARSWEYDSFRQVSAERCLDADGHLQPSWNGVAIEHYEYDARGLQSRTLYLDARERPVDVPDGYCEEQLHYDAGGRKLGSSFRARSGAEVKLPRLRQIAIRFSFANVAVRGPSREVALARIRAARGELVAGRPFDEVALRYEERSIRLKDPGDIGYTKVERFYQAVSVAIAGLKVGDVSEVVEIPYGFSIYQRTE